jgi:hypothetical protein
MHTGIAVWVYSGRLAAWAFVWTYFPVCVLCVFCGMHHGCMWCIPTIVLEAEMACSTLCASSRLWVWCVWSVPCVWRMVVYNSGVDLCVKAQYCWWVLLAVILTHLRPLVARWVW